MSKYGVHLVTSTAVAPGTAFLVPPRPARVKYATAAAYDEALKAWERNVVRIGGLT